MEKKPSVLEAAFRQQLHNRPNNRPPTAAARRLGHPTSHFNVGQYRRKQRGEYEVQDAAFFDHKNTVNSWLVVQCLPWLACGVRAGWWKGTLSVMIS